MKCSKADVAQYAASVAPLAGAWIEILHRLEMSHIADLSLPSRERGLKFVELNGAMSGLTVAPLAGAWIEMGEVEKNRRVVSVAPLAGAWIEIKIQ